MSRTVIIGAGLAGLSAACHLAGRGHDVTVVERDLEVGGLAGRLKQDGFAFDTGPTVLTAPGLLADTLRAAGADPARELSLRRLDPAYRACYADGSMLRLWSRADDLTAEIAAVCDPSDAAAFVHFTAWLRQLWEIELPHFIDTDVDSPLDLLRSPAALARLIRLGGFGRLGPAVRRFFRDPRLHRVFSFQALYAGLAPDRALALYAVITYLDTVEGVWSPAGGMHEVPGALARAATAAGATIRLGQPVTELFRGRDGRIAGVRLVGDRLHADAIICTVDPAASYATLLPDLAPRRHRRARYSPSAVVWHVGVRGPVGDDTAHHNLHFGTDWNRAFTEMLDRGRLMSDPSRLVTVPSLDDPSAAPPGCSSLYVLEPVPNLNGRIDWSGHRDAMRERLHRFLGDAGYPDDVITEKLITPLDWADRGLTAGTPFALSHTFGQTGPFRPPMVDSRVPGLFFAGAGTVPGVGVPMVLISGRLAAGRVARYLGDAESIVVPGRAHVRR